MWKIRLCRMLRASALAACGSSTSDRALSGAGIGAGVGAVGGALTNKNQINLGRPWWK